ncbi:hypothetical protein FHJ30_03950 [Arthrobacter sp. BB-1]|uniref:hypothetical protein n=1 Tax=unclassified Arthrobacter TaxID=235627 RepID=UPI001111F854|nr:MULTISPECIES: hypothetical protein [unclassified Arthrobacter]TNB75789.1 hypothetical protein FHJ30_03950 [Arthrobacter sp. BB-1]
MHARRPRIPFHFLRASAVATAILTLAAGAHLAGGGALPAPTVMLAVLALTALGSTTATRLRLRFPAAAALLAGGQLLLHEVFAAAGVPAAAAGSGTATPHASHLSGAAGLPAVLDHLYGTGIYGTEIYGTGATSGPLMLAAHILATLGSALLLAKGEDALWALAAWLRPLVALPRPAAYDGGAAPLVPFAPSAVPLRPWRNLRQDSRRGPPSAVALSS